MFDFRVSTHNHFDEACRRFALSHNMKELALSAGMNAQTLRNKLNPEQPHELTVKEMLSLTDLTEDSILMDGALAQLHCLPCVPVNGHAEEKLSAYVLKATAEVGQLAAGAMRHDALSTSCRRSLLQSVNTGIRCLTLAAIAVQTRIHSNPTMASTVDAISGLGASIGLS
ncbi:phage regulatory CII family protein [Pantoea ananatis]|uniref:phage regulatory CII family protein n=1 Tax=Pantoea ananas TaxID=553 RepID=UPI00352B0C5B